MMYIGERGLYLLKCKHVVPIVLLAPGMSFRGNFLIQKIIK